MIRLLSASVVRLQITQAARIGLPFMPDSNNFHDATVHTNSKNEGSHDQAARVFERASLSHVGKIRQLMAKSSEA